MEDETFSVLSFNIRFILDRWNERKSMVEDIVQAYDIVGMQEVEVGGSSKGQAADFARLMTTHRFFSTACFPAYIEHTAFIGGLFATLFHSSFGRAFRDLYSTLNHLILELLLSYIGASFLFHSAFIGDIVFFILGTGWLFGNLIGIDKRFHPEKLNPLLLGGKYRVAQRSLLHMKKGDEKRKVYVINTHLSDTPFTQDKSVIERCETARVKEFLAIMNSVILGHNDSMIIMGDMNSPPHEELHSLALANGFRSAFKKVHGNEPPHTFHQSHECATKDVGPEECYDYIFYKGPLDAVTAQLVGAAPSKTDVSLYPSDHYGITATFKLT